MGTFITTWSLWIYLIGIPITYAIMEDPEDKGPFEAAPIHINPMIAILWPIMSLYCICITLAYLFYWITKKIKNKLKH